MTRSYPALARFLAMGLPMMPSPIKPIGAPSKSAMSPLPLSVSWCPVPHISQPFERRLGGVPRPVFETHPAIVSGIIQRLQHKGIVDLTGPGFVSGGTVGDLHMPDQVNSVGNRGGEISTHALSVIDIVLQQEIGMPGSFDDRKPQLRCRHKVARGLERVERLDNLKDPDACGGVSGIAQVLNECRRLRLLGYVGETPPRQAVQTSAAKLRRYVQPIMNSGAELLDPVGIVRHAAITGGEVARGKIEQHLLEIVTPQLLSDRAALVLVRKQELNSLKTGRLGT